MATERRRCLITDKQVHPRDGFGFGQHGAVFYSFEGYAKHREALALLNNGECPEACHECGADPQQSLNDQGQPALYLHLKDGIYQALCRKCSDLYEVKAKERYKETPYGAARKL
jgi:hypothetical protein